MNTNESRIKSLLYNTPKHTVLYPLLFYTNDYINNKNETTKNNVKQQLIFSLMVYDEDIPADVVDLVNELLN